MQATCEEGDYTLLYSYSRSSHDGCTSLLRQHLVLAGGVESRFASTKYPLMRATVAFYMTYLQDTERFGTRLQTIIKDQQ